MKTGDNNIRLLCALTNASSVPKQAVRECWGAQDIAELYRVADHLKRLGFPVVIHTGSSDEGDPWAVFERHGTGDVVVHVARIDTVLVVVDVAQDRIYRGADFRAVADQLMADVRPLAQPPRGRSNVVMHPSMAMTVFVGAALVAASLADPASADAPSDTLARPDPHLLPGRYMAPHVAGQEASQAFVTPLDSLQVMQSAARARDPSVATSAVLDSPVLHRVELSERLAGRDTVPAISAALPHGGTSVALPYVGTSAAMLYGSTSAALPYGGMGMGVAMITMPVHFATPQPDVTNYNEGCALPEDNTLAGALPTPDCDIPGLLSAWAAIISDTSLNSLESSVAEAGQGGVWAQAAKAASEHPNGTTPPLVALPPAQAVDAVPAMAENTTVIETAAVSLTTTKPPASDESTDAPTSSDSYAPQVTVMVSPVFPAPVDAPNAINPAKSVVIFDHVVESIWSVDRIVLLGLNAEAPDALPGGAIVLQIRLEETDKHVGGSPDVLPESALTVSWPMATPDADAGPDVVPESVLTVAWPTAAPDADGTPNVVREGALAVTRPTATSDPDDSPDVVSEGALTVAWPTADPDIVAEADAPLSPLETYVLADKLSDLVTLKDDTPNVVVYLGGTVNVMGFEFGRDRIVMVEDAAGHDWLRSADILGQDVVLTGLDGGSLTLFGAVATLL